MSASDELRVMAESVGMEIPQVATLMMSAADSIEGLDAENAKLRELVQDMFGAYKGAVEMLPSSYSKNVMKRAVMDISDRMRELGVEL